MPVAPKSRLGRGLSGLLSQPVSVRPPAPVVDTPEQAIQVPETGPASRPAPARAASAPAVLSRTPVRPSPAPTAARNGSASSAPAPVPDSAPGPDASGRAFREIALDDIRPNRFQPRGPIDDEGLRTLAESIRTSGLMQPIAVRPLVSGARGPDATGVGGSGGRESWELVAGERRWRAARLAGLERVPALIVTLADREAAEWAIVENVQREDLNPIDRALAFRRLVESFNLTQAQIAQRVGMDRSTVANTMRLGELEPALQALVRSGALSLGHGKALLAAPPGAGRVKLGEQAAAEGWSVRALEQDAAGLARVGGSGGGEAPAPSDAPARSAAREALERQLSEHLGTKVRIAGSQRGTRGRISLDFYSIEHFDGLMKRLGFEMRS